jgi:hypothetical protein
VIAEILPEFTKCQNPDLILYQAGMDPYDTVRMVNEVLATVKFGDKIEHHGKEPYRWSVEGDFEEN